MSLGWLSSLKPRTARAPTQGGKIPANLHVVPITYHWMRTHFGATAILCNGLILFIVMSAARKVFRGHSNIARCCFVILRDSRSAESHRERERRLDNAHLIPPSRHYPPPNSNFIWQWLHAHAIFLHFHRHLSLFEWSLLILARTLIWNRIWTTHMQRCNSNKFKLASMDFWYSERHDIRTGLEASAVDSHSTLNHFLVLWNYHCRFTVDWKWTVKRM